MSKNTDIAEIKTSVDQNASDILGKEDAFSKNSAFNRNLGSSSGTVCEGDDSRLSDDRNPTTHAHAASDIDATGATDTHVLTADGAGNANWQAAPGAGATMAIDILAMDSSITAVANTHYICDLSLLTSDRDIDLPSAAAGDQVRITATEDAPYPWSLNIGTVNSTVYINGSNLTWSVLLNKGETVTFQAINDTDWLVVHDGRLPCFFSTRLYQNVAKSGTRKFDLSTDTFQESRGVNIDLTNDRIGVRRANKYSAYAYMTNAPGNSYASPTAFWLEITGAPSGSNRTARWHEGSTYEAAIDQSIPPEHCTTGVWWAAQCYWSSSATDGNHYLRLGIQEHF